MERVAVAVVRRAPSDIGTRVAAIGIVGTFACALISVAYWAAEWLRNYR